MILQGLFEPCKACGVVREVIDHAATLFKAAGSALFTSHLNAIRGKPKPLHGSSCNGTIFKFIRPWHRLYKTQRAPHSLCSFDEGFELRCGANDSRDTGFDNLCFIVCDLLEGVSQDFRMFKRNRGDHRKLRHDKVCHITCPANARFDHCAVDALIPKMFKGHEGGHLEEGEVGPVR